MVHDKIENLSKYLPVSKVNDIMAFLDKVSADMPETKYEIDGEDVYARVMSYATKYSENCEIEAHDVYCDIQFSIVGSEGISIYRRDNLQIKSIDVETDFVTFDSKEENPYIRVHNLPGFFTMIFPHEAHRPQESYDRTCGVVKKGVIKIKESCIYE